MCAHCAPSKVRNDWKSVEARAHFMICHEGVASRSKWDVRCYSFNFVMSIWLSWANPSIERDKLSARSISQANSILSIYAIWYLVLLYSMSTWILILKILVSTRCASSDTHWLLFEWLSCECLLNAKTIPNERNAKETIHMKSSEPSSSQQSSYRI